MPMRLPEGFLAKLRGDKKFESPAFEQVAQAFGVGKRQSDIIPNVAAGAREVADFATKNPKDLENNVVQRFNKNLGQTIEKKTGDFFEPTEQVRTRDLFREAVQQLLPSSGALRQIASDRGDREVIARELELANRFLKKDPTLTPEERKIGEQVALDATMNVAGTSGGIKKPVQKAAEAGAEIVKEGSERFVDALTQPKMKDRGFIKTVADSPTTTEPGRQAVKGLDQQYAVSSQKEVATRAKQLVDTDYDEAVRRFNKPEFDDEVTTVGQELIRKAEREGRYEDMARLVDNVTERATKAGQGNAALALWGQMTPEGIMRYASQRVRGAREASGALARGSQSRILAGELKEEVGAIVPKSLRSGSRQSEVVDEVLEQMSLPLEGVEAVDGAVEGTAKVIARRTEEAITPEIERKANTLADEISKKIRQEMIETPPNKQPREASDILREVFERNQEGQDAFARAKAILQEKYANVPKVQEALQGMFDSELGSPAAGSTINRAIQEQLKKNGKQVREIIKKSLADQKLEVEEVANGLIKEGFDEQSARTLSEEVVNRLNIRIRDAKISTLNQMAKKAPERAKQTIMDKINKLSNLGALDEADFLDVARGKLNVPQLTAESAQRISKLSQELQSLADGPEKLAKADEIIKEVQTNIPASKQKVLLEAMNLPRILLSSWDASAPFRQGLVLTVSKPAQAIPAFAEMIKAGLSKEVYEALADDIALRPNKALYDQAKLYLAPMRDEITSLAAREEQFMSNWAKKIPGIAASERAYTAYLNKLRADVFDATVDDFIKQGITPENNPEAFKGLARWINIATGRGELGAFEAVASPLANAIFSPRYTASRMQLLNPLTYHSLPAPVRKQAMKSVAATAGTIIGLLSLAKAGGADVETDWRSSDFGKIKVGNTRLDMTGGFSPWMRLAAQMATGERKTISGDMISLKGDQFPYETRLDVLFKFAQQKASPQLGLAFDVARGKDMVGEPLTIEKAVMDRAIPLYMQDMAEAVDELGLTGAALAVPAFFGAGIQTYEDRKDFTKSNKSTKAKSPYSSAPGKKTKRKSPYSTKIKLSD